MLLVGLTGNIGSGKSTIAGVFSSLGIPVFHADSASKKLLEIPEVRNQLRDLFGVSVFDAQNAINRQALANLVFNDPSALNQLNKLLHPLVIREFTHWTSRQSSPYVLHEAAIIFEQGLESLFNRIIHVSCPEKKAIDRVVRRDRVDGNTVLKRMQFQWPDQKKLIRSDHVILNDGDHLVIPQVLRIHQFLLKIHS